MKDYSLSPESIIDTHYSSSENPPKTKDTIRTLAQSEEVMENDEFIKLRQKELKTPLP